MQKLQTEEVQWWAAATAALMPNKTTSDLKSYS